MKGRGEFPSPKFQWCLALLKGLPFLDWLEEWDPKCKAIIMIAKRKEAALAHAGIPEWIEKCEFHNHRSVWHAILNVGECERNTLLERAGFEPLNHRSLECEPCVNSSSEDLARLGPKDYERIASLEQAISTTLFSEEIAITVKQAKYTVNKTGQLTLSQPQLHKNCNKKENDTHRSQTSYLDLFYRGCGNHFGCGL